MWCSVRRIRGVVCHRWRHVEALGQYESRLWWRAWILLWSHRRWGTLRVRDRQKQAKSDNASTLVFMLHTLECLLQFSIHLHSCFLCTCITAEKHSQFAMVTGKTQCCPGRREWCHFGLQWMISLFSAQLLYGLTFPYDFSRKIIEWRWMLVMLQNPQLNVKRYFLDFVFLFFFYRWKRQSAEENFYKMDKSASDEGENFCTVALLFPLKGPVFDQKYGIIYKCLWKTHLYTFICFCVCIYIQLRAAI